MNIFLYEIKAYFKPTLKWALSLSVIVVLFLLMYPAFTKDMESTQKALANFPVAYREALGISLQNFFTIFGFYAYLFTFVTLAGAVQAMNIGVSIISKEDSNKTADFLLSKPVRRAKVLSAKSLAALSSLVLTNIIFDVVALVTAKIVSAAAFSYKTFILISLTLFLVQLIFLAIGILFSIIIPKIKSTISVSLPTVFAFFIIGMLGSILGNMNVRYATPFKFYDLVYIINHSALENKFLLIEAIFIIVAIGVSFFVYIKKDIRAAT